MGTFNEGQSQPAFLIFVFSIQVTNKLDYMLMMGFEREIFEVGETALATLQQCHNPCSKLVYL